MKSSSFSSSREVKLDTDLEILAVELTSHCNKKFLACCIYKPPQNINRQWLEEFNLCLAKLCSDHSNILLCCDFNFPRIDWNSPEVTTDVDEVQLTELLNDYYLTQVNTFPTRGDHILDFVITSVPGQVQNLSALSPTRSELITDHSTLIFDIVASFKTRPKIKRTVFDYNRENFNSLRATLQTVNLCGAVETAEDVDHGWIRWKPGRSCSSVPSATIYL